ncbi:MAG TPA: SGNH/GDSL hydrolase family protein [Ktedonobacteraceae bacterium]
MLKDAHFYRRITLPVALAISLLFALAPVALAASHNQGPSFHLVGPKQHYLALGDSLAFGFQPNGDFTHGYVPDLFQILQNEGTKDVKNLGCPGETSGTLINGGICSYSPLTSQLNAAVAYLQANAGKVSPITLDIGANDVLHNTDPRTCEVNVSGFDTDLTALDSNLKGTILPTLLGALTIKGKVTGSIVMMNYYDPLQNFCPNTVSFTQTLNQHLAADVSDFGIIVDVFTAFGGPGVPNPNLCTYTWICSAQDIHATNLGYSVIANTFAAAIPQD